MEVNKIFKTVHDKIQYIKKNNRKPSAIVVSKKIYHNIQSGYYSEERNGMTYPFFPDFSIMGPDMYDKLFGLPLSILNTNNENYIEVYTK